MNYEIAQQAKIRDKPVPKVLHSLTPHHPQANFSCRGTKATVKPPSNQVSTKHAHYTLESSFLYVSDIVWPSIRARGLL